MALEKDVVVGCERAHYLAQLGTYFTELTDMVGVRIAYTRYLADIWYNQAYGISLKEDQLSKGIDAAEGYLRSKGRVPCFYLHLYSSPQELGKILEARGYAVADEELWMFYEGDPERDFPRSSGPVTLFSVDDDASLDKFMHVYRFGLPGPEVEKYIQSVVDSFHNLPVATPIIHYVAEYEGQPAAIMSVHLLGKYAGVYNVATLSDFQRKGLAKMLLRRLIIDARQAGAEHIFLQTGAGSPTEEVFGRMGFHTQFVRYGYTPKEKVESLTHG